MSRAWLLRLVMGRPSDVDHFGAGGVEPTQAGLLVGPTEERETESNTSVTRVGASVPVETVEESWWDEENGLEGNVTLN